MPWELVIFDNDGVLVDSERLANEVLARLLSELWRPTTVDECIATYLGGSIERVRALVEAESAGSLPPDFEDRYHSDLFAAFEENLVAVPGVDVILDALEAEGTPYCVASSGSRTRIERALRRVGLWDRFAERAFSAEEVANGKPAPDLLLHAAASLGADPAAAVVVEDSPLGVEAATAAGMAVIGFAAVTPRHRIRTAGAVVGSMEAVGELLVAGPPLRGA
jgi:HAD superfamily hydrolase (TIGR01509 family)